MALPPVEIQLSDYYLANLGLEYDYLSGKGLDNPLFEAGNPLGASSKVSAGFVWGLYTLRNVLVRNHRHIDPIFGANQMNRHAIHNAWHSGQIYSHQQISMGDV